MNLYELKRHHLKIALLIGITAVAIRLLFIVFTATNLKTEMTDMGDARYYWILGADIAIGKGYNEPNWPPLYPYFLGMIFIPHGESFTFATLAQETYYGTATQGFYSGVLTPQKGLILAILGKAFNTVLIVQAIVSAASAVLFYLSAVRLLGDVKGLLAGGIYTFLPWSLFYAKHILTEAIYVPLYILVLALLIIPKREMFDRFYYWIGLGIAIGLLTLARREAIQYAGMLVAFITLLRFGLNFRLLIKGAIISLFFFGLILAPLLIGNWQKYGEFVFSTTTGEALMDGNNPLCEDDYCPEHPPEWDAQLEGLNDLERDAKGTELAINWIKNNFDDYLHLVPLKLMGTWGFERDSLISRIADTALYGLALFGLIRLWRREVNWLTIGLISVTPILLVSANVMIFHGYWRFRAIAYPGMVLLAAYGIRENWLLWLIPARIQRMFGLTLPDDTAK